MGIQSLFRMMAVRAPRPLALHDAVDLSQLGNTEFQVDLSQANSLDEAISLCDRFVRGSRYLGDPALRPLLEALVNAEPVLLASGDPMTPQALTDYVQTLPGPVKQHLSQGAAVAALVKDNFIAVSYATRQGANIRRKVQSAVRVVAIVPQLLAGQALPAAALSLPIMLPPLGRNPNASGIKPSGIADLLIVNQELIGYQRSEIAYIENVMATETRGRNHRTLDRTTQTLTTETENTATTTRDLQSTSRSELSSETTRSIADEMSLSLGSSISANYGPVLSVDASADFSYGTSRDESSSTASNFAQDVVDRSVSTLTQRSLTSSTVTTLAETEEVNNHGFTNTEPGAEHVIGVYRWLDQRWRAQVMNYGRRLMLEFYVPEPAAVWHWAVEKGAEIKTVSDVPPELTVYADQVSDNPASSNYWMKLAKTYGATDLEPPPAETINVSTSLMITETDHGKLGSNDYNIKVQQGSVTVPEGYEATFVRVMSSKEKFLQDKNDEDSRFEMQVAAAEMDLMDGEGEVVMSAIRGVITITAFLFDIAAATAGVRLTCTRTGEAYQAWQIANWAKLKQANDKAWETYHAEVASLTNQAKLPGSDLSPDQKRDVERTELKRGALNLLIQKSFDEYDPVKPEPGRTLPEIDVPVALEYGEYLSFFEQAFQWINMTYLFYPYFWGEKRDWDERLIETDMDPVFEAFRKAGSARVQVPVRPGFERAVLYYLETNRIWGGRDAPVVGSPLYVPIAAEIAESLDQSLDDAEPYGDPWEFAVPTSLVVLDKDTAIIDGV